MKFCDKCQRILLRHVETGDILFKCMCGNELKGEPKDSLIHEEYANNDDTQLKYEIFIDNAAYDPARLTVMRECKKCKKDYMTMIRIGEHRNVLYTCDCGYKDI